MKKIFTLLTLSVFSLALFGAECGDTSDFDVFASGTLSGANEVPPVTTTSSGNFTLELHKTEDRGKLVVSTNIPTGAVTAAHLHVGAAGSNGPVVVDLMPAGQSDFISEFVPSNLTGNGGITTWAQFEDALVAGTIYINIHTAANPSGYIRGQIVRP